MPNVFDTACTVTVTYEQKNVTFELRNSAFVSQIETIENKYSIQARQNRIVFYGASNFALWTNMENDLGEYKVQNHGFGGSTDEYLVKHAPRILYPYNPKILFFQTGSNDYVNLSGTDEEKVAKCMAYKDMMFKRFHAQLPNTEFVVMSGLLLPGRKQYANMTMQINEKLKAYCEQNTFMHFVDATQMTYNSDTKQYNYNLFVSDEIHLNENGQRLWAERFIKPAIESIIENKQWSDLRK